MELGWRYALRNMESVDLWGEGEPEYWLLGWLVVMGGMLEGLTMMGGLVMHGFLGNNQKVGLHERLILMGRLMMHGILRNNQKMGLPEQLIMVGRLVVQGLMLWNIVSRLGKSKIHARLTRLFILNKKRQLF